MTTEDAQNSPIRVLIANLSGVLAQFVVQIIQEQPDMELIGQVHGPIETLIEARMQTDVLVLGAEQTYPPPGVCSHLLNETPTLKILVVSTENGAMTGYWLGVRRRRFPAVSPEMLLSNIRRLYAEMPAL